MKKIRINELARELEVKPGVILDMLPELGVQEKKTHSSSIDEDVALVLRERLTGSGAPPRSRVSEADHDGDEAHEAQEAVVSPPPTLEARAAAGAPAPEPLHTSAVTEVAAAKSRI